MRWKKKSPGLVGVPKRKTEHWKNQKIEPEGCRRQKSGD